MTATSKPSNMPASNLPAGAIRHGSSIGQPLTRRDGQDGATAFGHPGRGVHRHGILRPLDAGNNGAEGDPLTEFGGDPSRMKLVVRCSLHAEFRKRAFDCVELSRGDQQRPSRRVEPIDSAHRSNRIGRAIAEIGRAHV